MDKLQRDLTKTQVKVGLFFKTYFLGSKLGIKWTFNLVYDSVSFYKLDSKKISFWDARLLTRKKMKNPSELEIS